MKQYTAENILVSPTSHGSDPDLITTVTPESAGWDNISFQVRRLSKGQSWSFETGESELALVNLNGVYDVTSSRGDWHHIGGRENVFQGPCHMLYLPRQTSFTVTATQAGEFALAWVPTDQDHNPYPFRC